MERRVSLPELVRCAGVVSDVTRQPCLPAPTETAVVASEEDHQQARSILLDRRAKNPEHKDVFKRIFKSSKDKDKSQDVTNFSQEELDQALSAVLRGPTTSPGLTQAFIDLGAKVNFIEAPEKKRRMSNQPNTGLRRRSTVLQQAATLRRPTCVSLLASAGADQTTLDESLKAALTSNDQSCIRELLRHGADINKFPNALANAVRTNDQNFIKLLLRSPKPIQAEIISSCLPAAVQQKSDATILLLLAYGADPNFDSASALNMAIGRQDYKITIALVAGPVPLTQQTLQRMLDTTMRLPTVAAQLQFLQVLFCCGLPPQSIGLADLLLCRAKKDDTAGVKMMLSYGVSSAVNDAECLRAAISHSNWEMAQAILQTPISPQQSSAALRVLPPNTSQPNRLWIIQLLVQKGANGLVLSPWLTRAVEEGDDDLLDLLLDAGATVDSNENGPINAAVKRRDIRGLKLLLKTRPNPATLAKAFPFLYAGYSSSERLTVARLLLEHGASGPEVDDALLQAVADTSASRDPALIQELVKYGANVNHKSGKIIQLATSQIDLSLLQQLCNSKPKASSTTSALPFAFDSQERRHPRTAELFQLLLANGVDEQPASQALQLAIKGGQENIDLIKMLVTADIRLLSPAFEYTIAIEDAVKKAPILDTLLKMGVPQDSLDKGLAAESRNAISTQNTTSTKMLIEKGANVSYNDGEALNVAVASKDTSLTTILLSGKHQPSRLDITKAFQALFLNPNEPLTITNSQSILIIAQELLSRGVEQAAINAALEVALSSIQGSSHMEPLLDLLLQYNANVNTAHGRCFILASQMQDLIHFEKLLNYAPDFKVIIPALVSSTSQEEVVINALTMCFDYGLKSDDLDSNILGNYKSPVLVLAMDRFPRCEMLIKLMLDHGCNPDITVQDVIDHTTGEEPVSALLWALNQAQKRVSDSVIAALLGAGASVNRTSPVSEITPLALAAREGRGDIVEGLLVRGADASARDKWNRSALFYASSASNISTVQVLAPHALKNDGSLQEAARCLQLDVAITLIKHGHQPNYPSRLHQGRDALSELCLKSHVATAGHRSVLRRLIRLFLDHGADPGFRVRNEKSAIINALENPFSSLEVTEALLETEVWENLNDEKHLYRDSNGLWYSPLKYVELIPSPSRKPYQRELLDLLRDKGCEPRFYSESAHQPLGAIGLPKPVRQLANRQKEHELTLRHEQERHEQVRTLEETTHKDILRRKKEQQNADFAAQTAAQQHWQAIEQQKHEFEVHRVRDAERMKRNEKVAWHNLLMEQERDAATRRQSIEDRKVSATLASEAKMIEQRKSELDHRAGVERRMLKDKEDVYERNVKRQTEVMKRADESAQLHARLRQERPAIEGAPQWGSVD